MKQKKCIVCNKSITFHYSGKCLGCKKKAEEKSKHNESEKNTKKSKSLFTILILFIILFGVIGFLSKEKENPKSNETERIIRNGIVLKNKNGILGEKVSQIDLGTLDKIALRKAVTSKGFEIHWNEKEIITTVTMDIDAIHKKNLNHKESFDFVESMIPSDAKNKKKEYEDEKKEIYRFTSFYSKNKQQTSQSDFFVIFYKNKEKIHTIEIGYEKNNRSCDTYKKNPLLGIFLYYIYSLINDSNSSTNSEKTDKAF